MKATAIAVAALMLLLMPAGSSGDGAVLSSSAAGSGTQSDPYQIDMLAGDTFEYTLSTNLESSFAVTSGSLAKVGLNLNGNTISGTALTGIETVCITASAAVGPAQTAVQWIKFNVYNVLTISGTAPPSWAGETYSADITISDVDPDSDSETILTLNEEASRAGYEISKVSETLWRLLRTADKSTAGITEVIITAAASAGGISQTKVLSFNVSAYENVGFNSLPSGHYGAGLSVWLIQGDGAWEYIPEAVPEGASVSASDLPDGITFSEGKLTVSKENVFDSTSVTLTASSSAGGSVMSAEQILTVKVWNRLDYETAPSVSNIIGTIDGRTYTASVAAANYSEIVWDMGDGTAYSNVTSVSHEYSEPGLYTVRVTVSDSRGQSLSTSSAVHVLEEEPGVPDTPEPDNAKTPVAGIIGAALAAAGGIAAVLGGYFRNRYAALAGLILLAAGLALSAYAVWW